MIFATLTAQRYCYHAFALVVFPHRWCDTAISLLNVTFAGAIQEKTLDCNLTRLDLERLQTYLESRPPSCSVASPTVAISPVTEREI